MHANATICCDALSSVDALDLLFGFEQFQRKVEYNTMYYDHNIVLCLLQEQNVNTDTTII